MLDNIDLDILKFMSERENYNLYKDTITKNLCTKESWLLIGDYGRYFEQYPKLSSIDGDFTLWFRVTGHPGWKPEEHQLYDKIISNAEARPAPIRRVFLDQLDHTRQVEEVGKLHSTLRDGNITIDELHTKLAGLRGNVPVRETGVQTLTLDTILTQQATAPGFYWRLEDLNKSIGPIRRGDFILVGKRPEVGGTSFLVSEMSYMLEQFEGNAIIFNNEEAPDKVFTRMVSSALNVDHRTMMTAHNLYQQRYDKWLNSNTWDLVHDTSMSINSIHQQLKGKKYDLIGINVLLKVGGTGQKEDHDKFQALGEECRRIAQLYGPVLALVQADPSAEGVRYIPQDRIYKSKTALQGEADVQIMIGRDPDVSDNLRYIHVAKNKLPPSSCVELSCKRLKSEVEFNVGTGRYSSLNYRGHSRAN